MKLPDKLVIESLKGVCVCRFKDTNHSPDAPPHYYVAFPVLDDSSVLLSIITSQIENKKRYYQRANQLALSSLVYVDEKILPFLKKTSVVDCNQAELIQRNELLDRVEPDTGIEVIFREVSPDFKKVIVDAIKKSPVVKPYIKNQIHFPE